MHEQFSDEDRKNTLDVIEEHRDIEDRFTRYEYHMFEELIDGLENEPNFFEELDINQIDFFLDKIQYMHDYRVDAEEQKVLLRFLLYLIIKKAKLL